MVKPPKQYNEPTSILHFNEDSPSLSDYMPSPKQFAGIEEVIASFREESFLALSLRKRFRKINQTLYKLIEEAPSHSFLISAVLDYIDRVNREKLLKEVLNFASFEFWLNIFSELSDKENYQIRAKIAGKHIPRADYQAFFPIGMGRVYPGTHFVAAHLSPDIDTMIASFWGWMDAFAARLGTGLHQWSLPGGPPDSPITAIFKEMFGEGTFTYLARTANTLTLTSMDLVTLHKLKKESSHTLTGELDHGLNEGAIILVNEHGHYTGDWRSSDVELVRQIIISFKSCLRWFENNLHTKLISIFAKRDLSVADFPTFNFSVFDVRIRDCEPALDFNDKTKNDLDEFFRLILEVEHGLNGTFRDLNLALEKLGIAKMARFQEEVEALPYTDMFDSFGKLIENRPNIFHYLDRIINNLDEAIHQVRNYVERLDVVIGIKHRVLKLPHLYLTLRSDVEEMRQKMQNYDFLTVIIHEQDGSLFPVGIVRAVDLRKQGLGTVTFRDFCNEEEVKMASYLEVISVIDHHKSSLKTSSVPLALIGDAQSCNVLIAEQAFLINDRYSLGRMTAQEIEDQIKELSTSIFSTSQMRVLQRLLQRHMAAQMTDDIFYIHPEREFTEYFSFLHAILDDTDLLTKVSNRDVECVAKLLNKLKSLALRREVEIIHFDDIPKDKNFAKNAAQRLLQHPDMYSLYKKIYHYKEIELESNLRSCTSEKCKTIFMDTKEQNGCARIGQTKIFSSNFPSFLKNIRTIQSYWLNQAQESNRDKYEIDLHIHMISTIASAEEVYQNRIGHYDHQDQLWIWIPPTQQARQHLTSFLSSFQNILKNLNHETMHVEFLGPNADEYRQIFEQSFLPIANSISPNYKTDLPIAVLYFKASTLNSRKSMITPFIPRLIP